MLSATSPCFNNRALPCIWVIFFGFFLCSPALAMVSFPVLKSYQWLLNPHVASYFHFKCCLYRSVLWMRFCMHSSHALGLHQLWYTLNKDTVSNEDDWLKYPIFWCSFAISFFISHFQEAMFLQSWKTPMRNDYLWYFVISTYLDNGAENQLPLCSEIMRRSL